MGNLLNTMLDAYTSRLYVLLVFLGVVISTAVLGISVFVAYHYNAKKKAAEKLEDYRQEENLAKLQQKVRYAQTAALVMKAKEDKEPENETKNTVPMQVFTSTNTPSIQPQYYVASSINTTQPNMYYVI